MDRTISAAFTGGLVLGIGANLIADGISGQAREKGYTSHHIIAIGALLFGVYVLLVTYNRLKG